MTAREPLVFEKVVGDRISSENALFHSVHGRSCSSLGIIVDKRVPTEWKASARSTRFTVSSVIPEVSHHFLQRAKQSCLKIARIKRRFLSRNLASAGNQVETYYRYNDSLRTPTSQA